MTARRRCAADTASFGAGVYVRCRCGSRRVSAHDRRGIKSGRVVAVDYVCHDCGARQRVGACELTVPAGLSADELRRRGYVVW